mmetsp:Transcript_5361/g.22706  ORF Transcript_5361/g.22706 Transcript_5361/m.22706 type:complete len:323 (-) Transcript_5361:340-1308(-)
MARGKAVRHLRGRGRGRVRGRASSPHRRLRCSCRACGPRRAHPPRAGRAHLLRRGCLRLLQALHELRVPRCQWQGLAGVLHARAGLLLPRLQGALRGRRGPDRPLHAHRLGRLHALPQPVQQARAAEPSPPAVQRRRPRHRGRPAPARGPGACARVGGGVRRPGLCRRPRGVVYRSRPRQGAAGRRPQPVRPRLARGPRRDRFAARGQHLHRRHARQPARARLQPWREPPWLQGGRLLVRLRPHRHHVRPGLCRRRHRAIHLGANPGDCRRLWRARRSHPRAVRAVHQRHAAARSRLRSQLVHSREPHRAGAARCLLPRERR